MSYWLGIDLGTTYCAAAVSDDGANADMVSLDHTSVTAPSAIAVSPGGATVVGDAALFRAKTHPTAIAREFKRRFGDPTPIIVDGRPYRSDQLTVHLAKWVLQRAIIERGEPPSMVALTHPANWGRYKRGLLDEVANLAALPNVTLVSEPVASAWWYAAQQRISVGDTVGVYDLGGGTFDAVVLRRATHGFELIGQPGGIERLGGIDLDDSVLHFVLNAAGISVEDLDTSDSRLLRQMHELRDDCRMAKEALSADTSTDIMVELSGIRHQVRFTRSEFEDLARPLIEATVTAFGQAVQQAGLAWEDLTSILLVGGSSRVPLVAQMVGYATGRPVTADTQSKNSVALGAALFAHSADHGSTSMPDRSASAAQPEVAVTAPASPSDTRDVAPTDPGPESFKQYEQPNPLTAAEIPGHNRRRILTIIGTLVALVIGVGLAVRNQSTTSDTTATSASTTTLIEPATTTTASISLEEPPSPFTTTIAPERDWGRNDGWVAGPSADPERTANWAAAGPVNLPTVIWRTNDAITSQSEPVVADGVVYASFADSTIRALDLDTGNMLWSLQTVRVSETPVVTEDAVFYVDARDVMAVDRATGSNRLLRIEPPDRIAAPDSRFITDAPTIVDGVGYISYQGGAVGRSFHLIAVDLDTGEMKWRWNATTSTRVPPLMVTDTLVVLIAASQVIALDRESGLEQWRAQLSRQVVYEALVADGAVIVDDPVLRAFELTDGSERWSGGRSGGLDAAGGGLIITESLGIRAVTTATGEEVWEAPGLGLVGVRGTRAIGDGVVYVASDSSAELSAYDLETGAELWLLEHQTNLQGRARVTVSDGTLVAVEALGQLVAFR